MTSHNSRSKVAAAQAFTMSSKRKKPEPSSSASYTSQQEHYSYEGVNQFTQQFLRKMSRSKHISATQRQPTLLTRLIEVAKTLHMNELEIVVWSLTLDAHGWGHKGLDHDLFLLITGFQAKQYYNVKPKMALYYSKVSALRPDFPGKYKEWLESPDSQYSFSPADLNDRFNRYRRLGCSKYGDEAECVDYNRSVEDLLSMTTHSPFDPGNNAAISPALPHKSGDAANENEDDSPELRQSQHSCFMPLPELPQPAQNLPQDTDFSRAEQSAKPEHEREARTEEDKEANSSLIYNFQPEESSALANFGRTESLARTVDLPQQLIADEPMPRSWSSINMALGMSRQSTVHGDANKLLANPEPEAQPIEEEKKVGADTFMADLIAKNYFSKTDLVDTSANTSKKEAPDGKKSEEHNNDKRQ